jgi:hypothetical protein
VKELLQGLGFHCEGEFGKDLDSFLGEGFVARIWVFFSQGFVARNLDLFCGQGFTIFFSFCEGLIFARVFFFGVAKEENLTPQSRTFFNVFSFVVGTSCLSSTPN